MRAQAMRRARKGRAQSRHPGVPDSIELLKDRQVTRRATLPGSWVIDRTMPDGTCQQLWDTRELHLVSLDYGGETREVGAIDVNIDQDLVA